MQIKGTYTIAAPQAIVWPMLQAPQILQKVLPGCDQMEQLGPHSYQGSLKIKIGPVQGVLQGTVQLSHIHPPLSYQLAVNGVGAPGAVHGAGKVRLEADNDMTILHYDGDVQFEGPLADLEPSVLNTAVKAIMRQSLEGFGQMVQAQLMAEAVTATGADVRTAQPAAADTPAARDSGAAGSPTPARTPPQQIAWIALILGAGVLLLMRSLAKRWQKRTAQAQE